MVVLVEQYDEAVLVTIAGTSYRITKQLWEGHLKPAFVEVGYKIKEIEAPEKR